MNNRPFTDRKEDSMALTKAQVKEILSEVIADSSKSSECVEKIMDGHIASIEALRERAENAKESEKKLEEVQKELAELKKSDNGNKSPYKTKYEELLKEKEKVDKEFEDYKNEVQEKEVLAKKTNAYKSLLKENNISDKRIDSILKVTDIASLEFDKEGKLKDSEKLSETIKSEWADFIVTTGEQGASTSNPPQNAGGSVLKREDIIKIKDTAERQKAWAEYLENERKK